MIEDPNLGMMFFIANSGCFILSFDVLIGFTDKSIDFGLDVGCGFYYMFMYNKKNKTHINKNNVVW